jgi:hypothetical protein
MLSVRYDKALPGPCCSPLIAANFATTTRSGDPDVQTVLVCDSCNAEWVEIAGSWQRKPVSPTQPAPAPESTSRFYDDGDFFFACSIGIWITVVVLLIANAR